MAQTGVLPFSVQNNQPEQRSGAVDSQFALASSLTMVRLRRTAELESAKMRKSSPAGASFSLNSAALGINFAREFVNS